MGEHKICTRDIAIYLAVTHRTRRLWLMASYFYITTRIIRIRVRAGYFSKIWAEQAIEADGPIYCEQTNTEVAGPRKLPLFRTPMYKGSGDRPQFAIQTVDIASTSGP